jgi:hypothetical protein
MAASASELRRWAHLLREPVPATSSFILRHGNLKEQGSDDPPAACKATRGDELRKTALLSEIPRQRSLTGDESCHQIHTARIARPRPHRSQPTSSSDLLPYAMKDKLTVNLVLLCTGLEPAPRLNLSRAASPPRKASVWPGYAGGALRNCSLRRGEKGWTFHRPALS